MKAQVTKVQLHGKAFAALLIGDEVEADLTERAERILEATGAPDDFEVKVLRNRDRLVAFVRTKTVDGRKAEAEDRVLTRALDAGR